MSIDVDLRDGGLRYRVRVKSDVATNGGRSGRLLARVLVRYERWGVVLLDDDKAPTCFKMSCLEKVSISMPPPSHRWEKTASGRRCVRDGCKVRVEVKPGPRGGDRPTIFDGDEKVGESLSEIPKCAEDKWPQRWEGNFE